MNNRHRRFIALAIVLGVLAGTQAVTAQEPASAVFAGGCFWCMEKPFDELDGVLATTSGYAGGHVVNPTYRQVTAGGTGHREVVEISYDPTKVSYEELLYVFWRNVDPFDDTGQFCDRGFSYSPSIYFQTDAEREIAIRSAERVAQTLGSAVQVEIGELNAFYPAEDYHQDYYLRNPVRYRIYRSSCGRDRRLDQVWGSEAGGKHPEPWL